MKNEPVAMEVLQAIRRQHCDRKGREHECLGTCAIGPQGIELSCLLCGETEDTKMLLSSDYAKAAKELLAAAGVDFSRLSIESQCAVAQAVRRWKQR